MAGKPLPMAGKPRGRKTAIPAADGAGQVELKQHRQAAGQDGRPGEMVGTTPMTRTPPSTRASSPRAAARLPGKAPQNLLCAYLAGAVFTGLAASTAFGWWWLDGSVALLIAAWASRTTTGACREQARAAVETGPIAVGRTGTACRGSRCRVGEV